MFGIGKSRESEPFDPELSALPPNPAEYGGDYISPSEGKTNLGRAKELLHILNAVEKRPGE